MKVDDISGCRLDALAAIALGLSADEVAFDPDLGACLVYLPSVDRGRNMGIDVENLILGEFRLYSPSSRPEHAWPLVELEHISLDQSGDSDRLDSRPYAFVPGMSLEGQCGRTALEAIVRAYVSYKLGSEVPEQLIGGLKEFFDE